MKHLIIFIYIYNECIVNNTIIIASTNQFVIQSYHYWLKLLIAGGVPISKAARFSRVRQLEFCSFIGAGSEYLEDICPNFWERGCRLADYQETVAPGILFLCDAEATYAYFEYA